MQPIRELGWLDIVLGKRAYIQFEGHLFSVRTVCFLTFQNRSLVDIDEWQEKAFQDIGMSNS